MSYQNDRAWSNAYIPALRQIVGPLLLDEAPLEYDVKQATDLIVFKARDMRIGCRVRRPGYLERYPWDFTIRASRDSGAATELRKIVDGWGDWLVYGHAADDPLPTLAQWFVLDLHALRGSIIRHPELRPTSNKWIPNGDGTHLMPWDVRTFPNSLIVAASVRIPRQAAA